MLKYDKSRLVYKQNMPFLRTLTRIKEQEMKRKIAYASLLIGSFFLGLGFYYGLIYFPLSLFTDTREIASILISLCVSFVIVILNFRTILSLVSRWVVELFPRRFNKAA